MSPTALPEKSCFLIADPSEHNLQHIAPDLRNNARQKFTNLDKAADIAKIPRYFCSHGVGIEQSRWMSRPCERNRKRVFDHLHTESSWHNDDLVTAIKSEQRQRLFICGFWLDIDLTPTAMEAYVDGFDVHIVSDMVFSRNDFSHDNAMRRLIQIGVVPITLCQLIHEWMSWTADQDKANSLKLVLDDIIEQY